MQIGLQVPVFDFGEPADVGPTLRAVATTAEDAGFASFWVMDHLFQLEMIGDVDRYMLEAYTTLGHVSGMTERIRLGALCGAVPYRNPGLVVKAVTTLDVLSGGRAYFGIGTGWYEREAAGLGLGFPSTKQRFEMLEETLQIAEQMWSEDDGPYEGRHFTLAETICEPQPVSRPAPPVLIGGGGERKTLRLVAEYGDACNLGGSPEQIRHKLTVLRAHCDRLERDYEEIERTSLHTVGRGELADLADETLELLERLSEAGIRHAIFNLPDVTQLGILEQFGDEIIPRAAEL